MNIAPVLQRIVTLFRFELFQHVPDHEKVPYIKQLSRLPFHNQPVCEITEKIFVSNQLSQLRKFILDVKKAKMLHPWHKYKDYDLILFLYMNEPKPDLSAKILFTLLNYSIHNDIHKQKWNSTMNLFFSAGCDQDKIAALYFLEAE